MSIYSTHKPAAGDGGGLYLKVKDGETVKLRIASDPAIFESEGERDGKTTLTTRYGWTVFNQETNQAQILQQSATFFKNLAALAQDEEWGDPTGYDVKVSRQGSSFNDTIYTITPSANREPLDDKAKEAIVAIDLIEKLKASPFSQRVMWLSDYDKMAAEPGNTRHSEDVAGLKTAGEAKAAAESQEKSAGSSLLGKAIPSKPAPKIEDIGDEPINLDDIPF